MAVLWIVGLVVLVAGVVVVFAEAFSAYRTGGEIDRRLGELEAGQRELLTELRARTVPAVLSVEPPRPTVTLLEMKIPRTGRPEYVEVTQWRHAAPLHADTGRLRAITADYLASAEVDPSWPSTTARWSVVDGRAEDVGAAVHGVLIGTAVTEIDSITGLPADLSSALSVVPLPPGVRLATVARVAGVAVGPALTAASFKSLVRSDLTEVIGRAIGDGLFVDRQVPRRTPWPDAARVPPPTAWPFTDDPHPDPGRSGP